MEEKIRIRSLIDPTYHKSLLDNGIDCLLSGDKKRGNSYIQMYIEILIEKLNICPEE